MAIYNAKNTAINNPNFKEMVEARIAKAEKQLIQAEGELSKGRPDRAIVRLAISWLHAQLALKFANL